MASNTSVYGCKIRSKTIRAHFKNTNKESNEIIYIIDYSERKKEFNVKNRSGEMLFEIKDEELDKTKFDKEFSAEKLEIICLLRNMNMLYRTRLDLDKYKKIYEIALPEIFKERKAINSKSGWIRFYNNLSNMLQLEVVGENVAIIYFTDPDSNTVKGLQCSYSDNRNNYKMVTAFVED